MRPIRPIDNHGSIQLKFSVGGKRYSFNPIPGGQYANKRDLAAATAIATRINNDILAEHFDQTLERYRLTPKKSASCELEALLKGRLEKKFSSTDQSLLSLLKRYRKTIRTEQDAQRFIIWLSDDRASSTVQRYLNTLRAIAPMFNTIKVKLPTQTPPKPFTRSEVARIREWFTTYCPHYADFVACLFLTGMRTSEVIGLQWKDVDLEGRSLIISESLTSPTRDSKRIRKETKTGVIRNFPLSGKLSELLQNRYNPKYSPDTLIFTSPTGKPINDHNFSQRQWKNCLEATGTPHRPFYNTRHTFISHYLAETKDFVSCAALTHGTRTGIQTLMKHYAGLIDSVTVPELYSPHVALSQDESCSSQKC